MMKKHALLLGLSLALALMLCACDSGTPSTEPAADPSATDSGPRTDLNLSSTEAVETLDPHYTARSADRAVEFQIYEPLYLIDDDSSEIPLLATDYSVSEDGLTYTFNIRQGVQFHNGEELKASDVVFSYERSMESAHMYSYVEPIVSVDAPDDYTFVIELKAAYAPFMQYVAAIPIVNEKQCLEAGEDFALNPCGTGPYTLSDYQQNVSLSLQSFPDYWDGEPPIHTVNIKVITDTSTALLSFEAGELDYVSVPTASWADVQASGKYNTLTPTSLAVAFLSMNNEVAPFDNKLVRQAVNYALNREDICLMSLDGLAEPISTIANPDYVFGVSDDCISYDYDPDKARELLAEAGFADGFDAGSILVSSGVLEKAAQVVQSNLADVGITATVEMSESSAVVTDCMSGNYTLACMQVGRYPDFATYDMLYQTQYIDNINLARYSNPEVDELFNRGVVTLDQNERLAIYDEILSIVQEDAVYAPMFTPVSPIAYAKELNLTTHLVGSFFKEYSWN